MSLPVMRPPVALLRVYLHQDPVDFRKSFKGLAVLIEQELGHSPFSGELYVFRNRQRNKIKCLFWENTGFVYYYERFAEDKFHWLKQADELVAIKGQ